MGIHWYKYSFLNTHQLGMHRVAHKPTIERHWNSITYPLSGVVKCQRCFWRWGSLSSRCLLFLYLSNWILSPKMIQLHEEVMSETQTSVSTTRKVCSLFLRNSKPSFLAPSLNYPNSKVWLETNIFSLSLFLFELW